LLAGRHQLALQWAEPIDRELAASEPARRHRLAIVVTECHRQQLQHERARQRAEAALADLDPATTKPADLQVLRRCLGHALKALRDHRRGAEVALELVAGDRAHAIAPELLQRDLTLLGNMMHWLGHRQEAYDAFAEALAIARTLWPADDERVLDCGRDLAAACAQLGDYRTAHDLLRPALAHFERTLPKDDVRVLDLKQFVSQVLVQLGDDAEAHRLQREALAVLEAKPELAPGLYRSALLFYARILNTEGDFAGARTYVGRAIERLLAAGPAGARDLGNARTLLGVLERKRGDLAASRATLEEAHDGLAKVLQRDHTFVQIAAAELVSTCRCQGDTARARELADLLLDDAIASLQQSALAARETARLAAIQNMGTSHALSLAFDVDDATRRHLLGRTLLVSQLLLGASHHVVKQANRRHAAQAAELLRLEAAIAAAARAGETARVAPLVAEKEALERRLRDDADGERPALPSLADMQRNLPPGAVAIATVPFTRRQVDPTSSTGMTAFEWLAGIVLRPDGDLRLVDLGRLDAMTAAVDAMSQATHKRLRSLVVDRLRAAAGDATTWIVALDECLLLVPWDALPTSAGDFVGAEIELRRVPTLLDLTTLASAPRAPTASAAATPKLVAVGGVDYGPLAPPAAADGDATPTLLWQLRGDAAGFVPLPATLAEANDAQAQFVRKFPAAAHTVLTGADADKDHLLEALRGATIVHFATHGYVAFDRTAASAADGSLPSAAAEFAPFSLSGLALAGANRAADANAPEPGLLSAAELQRLDLGACYLTVLSACESAMGAWSRGQGLASLQSSLHTAGVRYVVSTLWPVDDREAGRFMQHFYAALWQDPEQPYRALRTARQRAAKDGLSFATWAAFQMSGT
jgi:CHAT domain-containing protein